MMMRARKGLLLWESPKEGLLLWESPRKGLLLWETSVSSDGELLGLSSGFIPSSIDFSSS